MKKLSLLLFLPLLCLEVSAQLALQWSTPVEVSGGVYDNIRPRIALGTGNTPVILWAHGNEENYYVSHLSGGSFTPPTKVLPDDVNGIAINIEGPELAVHDDTVFVSFTSLPYGSGVPYIVRSQDMGATFGDTVRVGQFSNGMALFAYVITDDLGNPIVSYMMNDPGWANPRYAVSRSTDGGQTFRAAIDGSVVSPGEVCECCPSGLARKDSTLALLYRNNDNDLRDIRVALSPALGDSFIREMDIDASNWRLNSCPSTGPEAIVSGDSLIAVWMSRGSGFSRVHLATAHLDSGTVGTSGVLDGNVINSTIQNFPQIAGNGDTVGVVWQSSYGGLSCQFAWSVTGASGLSGTTVEASLPGDGNQLNPDVAYANGIFHFAYQNDAGNRVMYRYARIVVGTQTDSGNQPEVSVFPNPAHGKFSWTTRGLNHNPIEIRILNVSGQELIHLNALQTSEGSVDISSLAAGLYFVEFRSESGVIATRELAVQ